MVKLLDAGITQLHVVLADESLYLVGSLSADAAPLITPNLVHVTRDLLLSHVSLDPVAREARVDTLGAVLSFSDRRVLGGSKHSPIIRAMKEKDTSAV
jgi:hypothetical protein